MSLSLKPAPGRRVRHADGRLFAAEGEHVPATPFYLRLRHAGDLVPAEDAAASAREPAPPEPPESPPASKPVRRPKKASKGSNPA